MKSMMYGVVAIALLAGSAGHAESRNHGGQQHESRSDGRGERSEGWAHEQKHDGEAHQDQGRHLGWENGRGRHHWNRGERVGYDEWRRTPRIDYRRYRLSRPPQGYEWRRQNDQFLLGSIGNGQIAAVILRTIR